MARKLVEMKEAAEMLGVTPDELNDIRSRGEIHGYRDGATWKFKMEEIERVADERNVDLAGAGSGISGGSDLSVDDGMSDDDLDEMLSLADIDDESDEDMGADSILVTEEPRASGQSTSSTIIGKAGDKALASDSDISMGDSGDMPKPGDEGDVKLTPTANGSDIELTSPGSDMELETGSESGGSGSESGSTSGSTGDLALEDSSDEFELDSDVVSSSTGNLAQASGSSDLSLESDLSLADDLEMGAESGLALGEDDEDDLEMASASDLNMAAEPAASSELVLGSDDDDGSDLVLGGESDLTLGAGDSGINLSQPGDSGLSLEEPLDLGDSAVDSSLELPEEIGDSQDIVALDAAADAATQLKADDEFLLTPVEEAYFDESDSGSQVIALEDSEAAIDQHAAMLQPTTQQPALLVDDAAMGAQLDAFGAQQQVQGVDPTTAGAPMPYTPAPATPEAPYSIWNIIGLTLVLIFLGMSGMLMIDLMRNMWLWDQPYAANTSLMDMILTAFQMN